MEGDCPERGNLFFYGFCKRLLVRLNVYFLYNVFVFNK